VNKGLIFDIRRFAVHDGPGIRTTVFFKGCPLRCWWCHNPESHLFKPEETVRTIILDKREYCENETTGKWMTVQEILEVIGRDRVFYDASSGGVTLSGGEPLYQPDFLEELLERLNSEGIGTTVDTSGYAEPEVFQRILPKVRLFLYDLKLSSYEDHLKYTGVPNDRILENLRTLYVENRPVVLRFPFIPGITDTKGNIEGMMELLSQYKDRFHEINILPYHTIAKAKYRRLKKENKTEELPEVDKNRLNALKEQFETIGYKVKIGG
jgi:pyruvate formate lyase activating enzyme